MHAGVKAAAHDRWCELSWNQSPSLFARIKTSVFLYPFLIAVTGNLWLAGEMQPWSLAEAVAAFLCFALS